MNTTDVHGTLREMWETRPARPREDRQVAGVASAIARRYDIDPVLVRIGFVAAAVTGIGAALYIAGWIALPESPEEPGIPTRRPRTIIAIGLAIAAAISVGSLFGNRGGIVVPALAALALLYLLHRSRGERTVRPVTAAQPDAPTVATEGPSLVKESPLLVEEPTAAPEPTPPAWDPLGAAPFAWDLPEPGPAHQPPAPRPRRLPVTSVTVGIALLAGAATAVLLLLLGALVPSNVPLLFGVVLGVVGAGLVVGAFVRSGRGLIPIALILSALTWAALSAPLDRLGADGFGDFGDLNAAPTTLAQLQPNYQRSAGDIDLDLRGLALTGNGPVATTVSLGAGDITVRVPADTDVRLNGSAGLGDVTLGKQENKGPGAKLDVEDLGADNVRSGQELVLTLSTGAGDVEVRRG